MDDNFSHTVGAHGRKVKRHYILGGFFYLLNAVSANESLKKYSYMRRS